MSRMHPAAKVDQGIARFLADFREFQSLDAEPEFTEPDLCRDCLEYPAAYAGRCFQCNASRRLPC